MQTEADPAELERGKQLLRDSKERLVGLGVRVGRKHSVGLLLGWPPLDGAHGANLSRAVSCVAIKHTHPRFLLAQVKDGKIDTTIVVASAGDSRSIGG